MENIRGSKEYVSSLRFINIRDWNICNQMALNAIKDDKVGKRPRCKGYGCSRCDSNLEILACQLTLDDNWNGRCVYQGF